MRRCVFSFALILAWSTIVSAQQQLTPNVRVTAGPVNKVLISRTGAFLAVYGAEESQENVERLLLTHGRRDVVSAAFPLIDRGVKIVAPSRESYWLEKPHEFWRAFTQSRFHDYAQQSTKVIASPISIDRKVKEGDVITWRDIEFRVLETAGYTRGSVSYVARIDGKKIAFTGDLIYGDGQILDLYSFQDAIPEGQIRGYHGYGSRLAGLVAGLKLLEQEELDLIVPARGPVIKRPKQATGKLIQRVQALYRNYVSTSALHWYFKEQRMRQCGQRVLGQDANIELMPYSRHEKAPNWVFEQGTSRLIISESGNGFLLDCGTQGVLNTIKDLIQSKIIKKVDGIFVTHFHDDHTDKVQAAAEEFGCPVYATSEYSDLLEQPEAYHLPAMTANAIKNVTVMRDGQTMRWNEFEFTFHFFPGQTYHHGAMFVEKKGAKPIFFIGDAFAPSGIDDYCVLNRNLVHEDSGYLLCLKMLRGVGRDFWLVNEHIPYVFSFSAEELDYLEQRYRQRIEILKELFPWDNPNYGIDEQWSVFYPYGVKCRPRATIDLQVRITNHSAIPRTFSIRPHASGGTRVLSFGKEIQLLPRATGTLPVQVRVPANAGNYLITADVQTKGMDFQRWTEALISVE